MNVYVLFDDGQYRKNPILRSKEDEWFIIFDHREPPELAVKFYVDPFIILKEVFKGKAILLSNFAKHMERYFLNGSCTAKSIFFTLPFPMPTQGVWCEYHEGILKEPPRETCTIWTFQGVDHQMLMRERRDYAVKTRT
jgi:hypothetical protein